MQQHSLYGLYNTITLGVAGTPMRAFTELSEADRWALAFLAAQPALRRRTRCARAKRCARDGKGKQAAGHRCARW
jgi:high-affinity iron transporter